jgi:tetratricopeptide (TPR) repeat protein
MRWRVPLALGLVALLGLGSKAAADAARAHKSERAEHDVLYVPRPAVIRVLSFGYEDLVADWLWLRTITYYGGWRRQDHGVAFFQTLAETVLELDPNFTEGYRFAAVVMADDLGRIDEAIALLEKGMAAMPQNWWLPFEAGFLEYTVRLDDQAAYRWFERAARIPGAPDTPRRFAAFVASRAGALEVSYELWRVVAETAESKALREKALQYMEDLEKVLRGEAPVPEWATRRRVINGRVDDGDV